MRPGKPGSAREVLIVGSGKRVLEAALPALQALRDDFRVRRIFARTAKRVECDGQAYTVAALDELTAEDVAAADLVYLAVGKDAVPGVLARLSRHDVRGCDLLLDTPVVRFKHFRHAALARRFRAAWVAEDCSVLPWFDAVRAVLDTGRLGALRSVDFFHSAYAYHGVAAAKALLGTTRVRSGRRQRLDGGTARRTLTFAGGKTARVLEPRDYSKGRVLLTGERGTISDFEHRAQGNLMLSPTIVDGACRGFEAGNVKTHLSEEESRLMGGVTAGASVTSLMEPMKRAGFLRLLRGIARGDGAYPLIEGLDDMVVDYHLEKVGRYVANPFTSVRSPLARALMSAVSLLARS